MHPPTVSIIINNFNYACYLRESIDSALAQTHPVEVIVVDDASGDESRAIIEVYAGRVTAVFQAENRGQGAAFNAGFEASCGQIVMFLDADDWLYPHAVGRVVADWRGGQSKTHFRLDLVDAKGVKFDTHPAPEVRLDCGDVLPVLLETGRYETVVTSGNAYARAALQSTLPVPEPQYRTGADGYLSTVVPFHGPVTCIEDCLGAYRVHSANAYAIGSGTLDLCGRMRTYLAHDVYKDRALRLKAAAAGRCVRGTPQFKDALHLERRLASLRLAPATHPHPGDGRLRLTLRGVLASRRASLSWRRRAVWAVWFMAVGLLPRGPAGRAIEWKLQPASRPPKMMRSMARLRRILG